MLQSEFSIQTKSTLLPTHKKTIVTHFTAKNTKANNLFDNLWLVDSPYIPLWVQPSKFGLSMIWTYAYAAGSNGNPMFV